MKNKYVLSIALGSVIDGASGCYGSKVSNSISSGNDNEITVEYSQGTSRNDNTPPLPWSSVDEVRKYIYGLKESEELDLKYIEGQIIATADAAIDTRRQEEIEDAICKLWEARGCISGLVGGAIMSITRGMKDYSQDELRKRLEVSASNGAYLAKQLIKSDIPIENFIKGIKDKLSDLLITADKKLNELAGKIIDSTNWQDCDSDFIQLAVYKSSLHRAEKNNKSYDFESLIEQMIDVYACTKNNTFKDLIKKELQSFNHDNVRFGRFGHKINDFENLEDILVGQ